jgi:DNA recombination protein RmuC
MNSIDLLQKLNHSHVMLMGFVLSVVMLVLCWRYIMLMRQYKWVQKQYIDVKNANSSLLQDLSSLTQQSMQLNESIVTYQKKSHDLEIDNARLDQKLFSQSQLNQSEKEQFKHYVALTIEQLTSQQSKTLDERNQRGIESSLQPFKEHLVQFKRHVDEIYDKELRETSSLRAEIEHLKSLNIKISHEATQLTQALRGNNKTQGIWGEMILEHVLQNSGLREGQEYSVQEAYANDEGKQLIPDVIVHLPNKKDVVIDSKVSLVNYQEYMNATNDDEIQQASKKFIRSMRSHISNLNSKTYQRIEGLQTLDFVLLFVPIEAAFLLILEQDPDIFTQAYKKQIVLVSPTTLFATLRTVDHLWSQERQNDNAAQIAQHAANLYDKLVVFADGLVQIGESIDKASRTHNTVLQQFSSGRGNILERLEKMRALGVPTKKTFNKKLDAIKQHYAEDESCSNDQSST